MCSDFSFSVNDLKSVDAGGSWGPVAGSIGVRVGTGNWPYLIHLIQGTQNNKTGSSPSR